MPHSNGPNGHTLDFAWLGISLPQILHLSRTVLVYPFFLFNLEHLFFFNTTAFYLISSLYCISTVFWLYSLLCWALTQWSVIKTMPLTRLSIFLALVPTAHRLTQTQLWVEPNLCLLAWIAGGTDKVAGRCAPASVALHNLNWCQQTASGSSNVLGFA